MRARARWAAACVVTLLAAMAVAQDFAGTVTDSTGASVTGAVVRIKDGGASKTVKTDPHGRFHASGVHAGAGVEVRAAGFAPYRGSITASGEEQTIILRPALAAEEMVVSATRTEVAESDTPADVRVLDATAIGSNAGLLTDDVLRNALGFSLFRRSNARAANPTSQGVSLRGVGASGASRALVLRDGVPLNDPFGGWVQWDRVPAVSLQDIEVVRGGVSDLYGADALSGVVSLASLRPPGNVLTLETSAGSSLQPDVSVFAATAIGKWQAGGDMETMSSPGYIPVAAADRGAIDRPASLDFSTGSAYVARAVTPNARIFLQGSLFSEARGNGTVLQTNSTHLGELVLGGDASSGTWGNFSVRAYGSGEQYHQSFSAIMPDRNTEQLTRLQTVPSTGRGASVQWDRAAGQWQHLVGGFEWRGAAGETRETTFLLGAPLNFIRAGGRSNEFGWFVEDYARLGSRWLLTGALRGDVWNNTAGHSVLQPVTSPVPSVISNFPDRSAVAVSPRLAAQFSVTRNLSVTASVYRSFRPPTLNELYRSFRLGSILTLANPALNAEQLMGGEAGVKLRARNLTLHSTFFWSQVDGPIANATLSVAPALITRQRENLGATRARGLELEGEWEWRRLFLAAGYQWTDSTVLANPANVSLVGLRVPQVPPHQFTMSARYAPGTNWTLAAQVRGSGTQFDDDLNRLPLAGYATVDAFVSRRINSHVAALVAVENVLDQRTMVGRTPVSTFGPPLLARAGLRLSLGAR